MNKIEVTPVLVATAGKISKGDLCKNNHGELCIYSDEGKMLWGNWTKQLLYFTSDREVRGGDLYYWKIDNTIDKRHELGIANLPNCFRIESAYPTIEGCAKISPDFMQKFCANPKGKCWMVEDEDYPIIRDGSNNEKHYIHKDGYIVLEVEEPHTIYTHPEENTPRLDSMIELLYKLNEMLDKSKPAENEPIEVKEIQNRIQTEYNKYFNSQSIDWAEMAAHKIVSSISAPKEELAHTAVSTDVEQMAKNYKLYDKVTTDYYENEVFTVIGIKENELELQGDWSGGTHNVCQRSWYPINKCTKIK